MSELRIDNARLVLDDGILTGAVAIRNEWIAGVHVAASQREPHPHRLDLGGACLLPGLIDIHTHGFGGVDVMTADVADWRRLCGRLMREGVTGFFPTLAPTNMSGYRRAIGSLREYLVVAQAAGNDGARVLGVHFEGPYLNAHRCGALHPGQFRGFEGDAGWLDELLELVKETPLGCLMTVAPEIAGGIELIEHLVRSGVRVFIGHSQADPGTLDRAYEAGARHLTHFPNALDPMHHRKPGAVGWGLAREDVSLDCIADRHHIDPLVLKLTYRSKGRRAMALISDSVSPAGLGDGDFSLWGVDVSVRNGRASVSRGPSAGALAGSVITLREAVRNMLSIGVPLHEAVAMASSTPARIAGLEGELGSIEVGKRADLVALDESLEVAMVIMGGRIVLGPLGPHASSEGGV